MVVAILILALLTIIGIAAMSTTNVELKISGNEKSYKMECKGYGPARAESQIEAGFYRMGF